jgi:hypothetical protein
MTIPRRDLLTGTALILVGEKLARGVEPSGSNANAPSASTSAGGKCRHPDQLRTDFMKDFTAEFIGDPTKILDPGCDDPWPDPPKTNPPTPSTRRWPSPRSGRKQIADEYATFVHVLLSFAFVPGPQPPQPPTNTPNPAMAAKILLFLQNYKPKWPNATPIPPEYHKPPALMDERGEVNLVEIAVISDRLLQAINSYDLTGEGGRGGGGSGWPPH